MVEVLGSGVYGFAFRVWCFGSGFGVRAWDLRLGGLGFRVLGLGFGVWGLVSRFGNSACIVIAVVREETRNTNEDKHGKHSRLWGNLKTQNQKSRESHL